jgi:hypothetical protein
LAHALYGPQARDGARLEHQHRANDLLGSVIIPAPAATAPRLPFRIPDARSVRHGGESQQEAGVRLGAALSPAGANLGSQKRGKGSLTFSLHPIPFVNGMGYGEGPPAFPRACLSFRARGEQGAEKAKIRDSSRVAATRAGMPRTGPRAQRDAMAYCVKLFARRHTSSVLIVDHFWRAEVSSLCVLHQDDPAVFRKVRAIP